MKFSKPEDVTLLVTGATGFKGAWLSFWLNIIGAKVVGIGLKPEKGSIIFGALNLQNKIKPIYKTFKGWKSSTKGIKNFNDLPTNAKNYVSELGKFIETKISSISTSPERNDTILIEDPFNN